MFTCDSLGFDKAVCNVYGMQGIYEIRMQNNIKLNYSSNACNQKRFYQGSVNITWGS